MNAGNIQLRLKRRRLDDIFDFALLFLRENALPFLKFVLPTILFFTLLNTWLIHVLREAGDSATPEWKSFEHLALFALLIAEMPLIHFPVTLISGALVFSEKPRFRDIFRGFGRLGIRYFFHAVIWRTALYTVFAPLLITLWIGFVRKFFLEEVILLERLRGKDIRRRLATLSSARSDRIIGFLILNAGLALVLFSLTLYSWSILLALLKVNIPHWTLDYSWSFLFPLTHVLFFFYAVFHAAAKFIFYLDVRSQLEGWDIEILLRQGARESQTVDSAST